jgi:uncharacterized CHY-type Zn-finger protein
MHGKTSPPQVWGLDLDANTRCRHYHGPTDVIAIRMRCCGTYYACIECHAALSGHPPEVWPDCEWKTPAVLCGICGSELCIDEYLQSGNRCSYCQAQFNPGCRNHYHLYFEMASDSK